MLREWQQWKKMKDAENVDLNIPPDEWDLVEACVKERMQQKEDPPFKVTRKELQEKFKEKFPDRVFNHSFIVIPEPTADPDVKPVPLKIGAMSRAKVYEVPSKEDLSKKEKVEEGILGHGKVGVAKVVQWRDGSRNALKILPKDETPSEEFEIMKKMGVLQGVFVRKRDKETSWIDSTKIQDKQYVVMTLESGQSLDDYLKATPLKFSERLALAVKILEAIKVMHDGNMVHGDINLDNLMVSPTGEVRLIDFGLSKRLEPNSKEPGGMLDPTTGRFQTPKKDIVSIIFMFERALKLTEESSSLRTLINELSTETQTPGAPPPTVSRLIAGIKDMQQQEKAITEIEAKEAKEAEAKSKADIE